MKTPISDLIGVMEKAKESGIVFKEMRMTREKFEELISSDEFIRLWAWYYKYDRTPKTLIRVNKIMKKRKLLKIKILKYEAI
jgi:hypothetical protein